MLTFEVIVVSSVSIKGNFEHYNDDSNFKEYVKEVELVQDWDKCTEYPWIKFFSKAANGMVDGFLKEGKRIISTPQASISCSKNALENEFEDFTIKRHLKKATVVFKDFLKKPLEEISKNSEEALIGITEALNFSYFQKPLKFILRDSLIICAILVLMVLLIMKMRKNKNSILTTFVTVFILLIPIKFCLRIHERGNKLKKKCDPENNIDHKNPILAFTTPRRNQTDCIVDLEPISTKSLLKRNNKSSEKKNVIFIGQTNNRTQIITDDESDTSNFLLINKIIKFF